MAAVVQACHALRSGQSDMALAGAANLMLSPDHMISMSNLHMLNKDGRSYSFDNRGEGYGRGEGIATLVIKRLDDAIKANDPIRAVLHDASINQDGHTAGITLPSGAAQEALERQVWSNLNLNPQDVGYVEAHGTGTLAGDGAELDAISRVFCQDRDAASPLIVGSIKSNIGHLESVSGLAAMIKGILILENRFIPPNVNFEHPKANLYLEKRKIKVPQTLQPWPEAKTARVSVNSFGYGGTNAHAILERPVLRNIDEAISEDIPRLFTISAASQASLESTLARMVEWVSQHNDRNSLRDLAYTLSERRSIMPWRFSCVASNPQELLDAVEKASHNVDSSNRISPDFKINFIFTGQGAQWAGMGRELLADPVFRESIRQSSDILTELGSAWDLVEELLRDKQTSRLGEAEVAQPATMAVQIALVDLARQWGVLPDAVIGHSSGEIAAAYSAGYLSHQQAMTASYYRGFSSAIAKEKGFENGSMLAVGVGEDVISPYLKRLKQGIAIVACQNSPSSVTISGDGAAISELSDLLNQDDIFNRKLLVDTAYHSHHMQAAAEEYRSSLGNISQPTSPSTTVKMFSSVTGSLKSSQFDADYWVSNLVNPVRFCDALQSLCRADNASSRAMQAHHIFIEIGPHTALAGPVRQCIADLPEPLPYSYTGVLARGSAAIQSALNMASSLFSRGCSLDMTAVAASDPTWKNATVLRNLPSYSWDHRKRHWHESRLSRDYRLRKHPYHDILGTRMTDNTPLRPVWRHMVGVEGLPWLRDHAVDGLIVFPGSGYLCMAMEGALQLALDRYPDRKIRRVRLQNIEFLKGLVIPEGRARVEVQLAFSSEGSNNGGAMKHTFSVTAFTGDENWNENCRGLVSVEFVSDLQRQSFERLITFEEASAQLDPASTRRIQSHNLYQELQQVGNAYGPSFSGIEEMQIGDDIAISTVAIPDVQSVMPANHMRPHVIHPTTLDILLHSSLPLVNQKLGAGSVMPVRIEDMTLSLEMGNAPGTMLSTVATLTSSHFRAAEADMVVFPGERVLTASPILSVTGMELRSLAVQSLEDLDIPAGRDICYRVQWVPDERFICAESLQSSEPEAPNEPLSRCYSLLSEYLKYKCLKQSGLSVLEIGDGTSDATGDILQALQSHGSLPDAYDFTSPTLPENIPSKLQEWSSLVSFRELDIGKDLVNQGFQRNSYDVVVACNILRIASDMEVELSRVHQLLKPDGVMLLIHDTEPLFTDVLLGSLSQASFKVQLTTQLDNLTFTVARAINDDSVRFIKVRFIVSPSLPRNLRTVIAEMCGTLSLHGVQLSAVTSTSWDTKQPYDDAINVVIDDGSNPILSRNDAEQFQQVVDLLQRRSNVLWVSMQNNENDVVSPKKHLITGLARTAHAENEHLEMVTVDVQETVTPEVSSKLLDFLADIIIHFPKKGAPREREYVYTGTNVLVPRVMPNNTLNLQISRRDVMTTKAESFTSPELPLRLTAQKDNSAQVVFVEDESHRDALGEDFVEIEVKAFGVSSKLKNSVGVNEYAGVVAAIGSNVSTFKVGDRVVGWGGASYANRPRVLASQLQLLPDHVSFTDAAILPISFMTACHALIAIADVQPGQLVLIDGAASAIGQAALSVAQYLGARIIVSVNRSDEATFLRDSFNIPLSHIVARDSPFLKDQLRKISSRGGIDFVLGCARSTVPYEIVKAQNPFGTLVQIGSRGSVQLVNGTVSTFDIGSLIEASPKKASKLLEQVMEMASHGLALAPLGVTILPMTKLDEAIRQSRQDGMSKYVVQVEKNSIVKTARPSYSLPRLDVDATYVIAGGLGDLGRRMLRLLAKGGAKCLVTLSRSGSNSAESQNIERECQSLSPGLVLHCVKCDVSQEGNVRAALDTIKATGLPPVKGVIQASVVLQDSTLDTMTAETFNNVLEAKAVGTLNLQKVFAGEDLSFFISLSSAVNIIGTAGQANYNAANSLQDALAQFEKKSGCFYMTLNIGVIEDGLVNNTAIIQSLRRQGLTTIYPDELAAFLEYSLSVEARQAGCHQAVIGFTPESLSETTAISGAAHTLMFTHVRSTANAQGAGPTDEIKTFKDLVGETDDKDEIEAFVAQVIGAKIADLMSIDAADVNLAESMTDFGLDSLIAIELRNWIMREFSAPIQSSEVLDSPSIWSLAQKVTLRSSLTNDDSSDNHSSSAAIGSSTQPTTRSPSQDPQNRKRPLPVPDLESTLSMFVDSRRAVSSPEELEETERVVREFVESGKELVRVLKDDPSAPDSRLNFYDDYIHLERREPLQDHALFYIGHLTGGAPRHSQSERAAIITVAALKFKKRLENGTLEANTLNDIPLCMETLQWLFHTTQEPGQELDMARKYLPNTNVVVMRRGHLYVIEVHEDDDYASLNSIFLDILTFSEQAIPSVSVLTTKRRDQWAFLRSQLSILGSNEAVLKTIESAAFVVSLDDTAPQTSSERSTSILMNDCHLTNRWLDKMLMFTVAANGVSSLVGENSKLDGLSTRQLSECITDEIFGTQTVGIKRDSLSAMRQLTLETSPAMEQAIHEQTASNLARYKPIGSTRDHYAALSRSFLGSKGMRSKGTVLIAILMASRMFYGHFEPVWETVTLAKYDKGRIDWLQSLTWDIKSWIDAALIFRRNGKGDLVNLASKLKDAATGHVQALRRVADGHGYVEPLYSLLGYALAEGKPLPPLFESAAWKQCDRHLSPKKMKTDCLGSGGYLRMQEGGFLMPNRDTVFIHYEVHHEDPLISLQGGEEEVVRFQSCLEEAIKVIRTVIELGIKST